MSYHDGKLFVVDMFFITCLDAKTGQAQWKSWLGGEIYTSPAYADGKVYTSTDRRSIYVLNATNGERLSYFGTGSNSWSSPTIYEGRIYIGNNDWNVYCLDDSPMLNGQISVELDKDKILIGESVTGHGQLTPGIAYAPITLTFAKPDGSVDNLQVTALKDGDFSFTYTSDVVGNWTVSSWCSGATYIMHGVDTSLEVAEPQESPPEQEPHEEEEPSPADGSGTLVTYGIIAAATIGIVVIVVVTYLLMKKRKS
jgi:outer membrane protein assembly factor BamB